MTDTQVLQNILNDLNSLDTVRSDDVPDIALYMDQVTTFMQEHLKGCRRYEDDKIMTKTMINNYAKNNLIPSPEKKKYTRDHMLLFIMIYYLKSFMSIGDIEKLLSRVKNHYFNNKNADYDLKDFYDSFYDMMSESRQDIAGDLKQAFEKEDMTFEGICPEDEAYFHQLAFILRLCFDVYVKKQIIERLIDRLPDDSSSKKFQHREEASKDKKAQNSPID